MSEIGSLKISGSGSCGGGEFLEVKISGSGRVTGDVKCESMHISGCGRVSGEVDCKNDIRVSGSGKIEKNIKCGSLYISGAARLSSVKAGDIHISGSCATEGRVEGNKIAISGVLSAGGDICGETVEISGGIKAPGLLSGETVDIKFNAGCSIGEIGGGAITVRPGDYVNRSFGINHLFEMKWKQSDYYLREGEKCGLVAEIGSIEGDDVTVQNCRIGSIRGERVTILSGCEVKRVEYSGELNVSNGAIVLEQVKI